MVALSCARPVTAIKSREHEVNVGYRRIFSPHWVNQLRFLVGHNDAPVVSSLRAPQSVVEGYFTAGGAQADSKRTESHLDGTDFLSYAGGHHLLVFGIDVPDISRRGADDFTNSQGTYTFAGIDAYTSQQPSAFRIQTGNGHLVFWERTVAGFIEDTVRLRPSLSVSMGLRYYFQNWFHNDSNNLAPRLSFAFAPTAKSHTVFRGGAGFFFDRTGPRPVADLLHFDGNGLLRLLLPLQPGSLVPFPVTPTDLANVPSSLVVLDPRARIPYFLQYSFGVEHQVTAKSTLSATYVGSRGVDLFRSVDANAPSCPHIVHGQIRISVRFARYDPMVTRRGTRSKSLSAANLAKRFPGRLNTLFRKRTTIPVESHILPAIAIFRISTGPAPRMTAVTNSTCWAVSNPPICFLWEWLCRYMPASLSM